MYKLLKANLFKLKKDITFWAFLVITVVVAMFTVGRYNAENVTMDKILNEYVMYIGFFIAFLVSLFIGREYADGVMRNKIIVGHKRSDIYLSNLIICIFIGILMELVYVIIALIFGINKFENVQMSVYDIGLTVVKTVLVIIMYCSIYSFITMLYSNATISMIICIILFLVMYFCGANVLLTLHAKEYYTSTYIDEQGVEHITNIEPNPNYPSKLKRNVAKFIDAILPINRSLEISNLENGNMYVSFVFPILIIYVINMGGIKLFKYKDLK